MKGKGYRSSFAKAVWIVIAHLAAVTAAICAAMFIMIYQTGIRLDDRGKSYTESEAFEKQVSNRGSDILVSLAAQDDINYLKNAGSSAVIDLAEFEEKGNTRDSIRDLSLKNTSGLAYSVSDLLEWGKDWEANYYEGVYDEDSQIIRCESSDGTSHYFYRTDFKKMVADGTLKINYNTDFLEEDDFESKTESEKLDTVVDELYYGYTSQSENIGSVTDTRTNTEYPGCFFIELSQLDEKFAPQGAENILDAVNKSTEWNGRLEDAYKELFTLLDCISAIQSDEQVDDYTTSLASVFHTVGDYTEGSTNLTYLFADKETQTVYTNKEAYRNYAQLEQNLKKISEGNAYAIVRPELSECDTNVAGMKSNADLQVWNHTIKQNFDTEDFVYAVTVDTAFPIEDSMASEKESFEKYANLMLPMIAGAIIGCVLWIISMVWLTVAAGRKPEDEKLHLNNFDRWYTEITAGIVIGIWAVGTMGLAFLILNTGIASVEALITCLAVCGIYTMAWFLIGYLSLVRRIKAGTLWKDSLLRRFLKWIGKCNRNIADFAKCFSRNTTGKVKVLLFGCGLLLLQFLLVASIFGGILIFLLLFIVIDGAIIVYAIRKADGQDLIKDGLKKISNGQLQYKIKTDHLTGDQKEMAEYINNIGDGLDAAVENSLKKERMQTELITNVSHDLKTPLTSIINYVDLMKRENPSDPKIQEYLRVLDEKSQRLKVLTEDVVEASKASTGNIKLEMNDLDFIEMVQQVIGEFEEKFQEKNLTMMVHFTDEPSIIYADGQRMWRVLENVFGNVVKYAMEGTRVYAEISNRNKKVIFSLKNISAQPLNFSADELTERFIRGDVARNTEGSGLGLSIAKSLTELQGGEFKLHLDGDLFKVMITFAAKNCSEK